jgi:hypothetical protein
MQETHCCAGNETCRCCCAERHAAKSASKTRWPEGCQPPDQDPLPHFDAHLDIDRTPGWTIAFSELAGGPPICSFPSFPDTTLWGTETRAHAAPSNPTSPEPVFQVRCLPRAHQMSPVPPSTHTATKIQKSHPFFIALHPLPVPFQPLSQNHRVIPCNPFA